MMRFLFLLFFASSALFAQSAVSDEALGRALSALEVQESTVDAHEMAQMMEAYRSHVPALYRRYEETNSEFKQIEARFAKAGIPSFFALIPYCESKFNPAHQGHRTAGLWQFSRQSARNFGLTVRKGKDERLDVARSTEAVIRYMQSLKERFGSWYLADFAFAMGEGTLQKLLRHHQNGDLVSLLNDPRFPKGAKAHFAKTLLLSAQIHHADDRSPQMD